jgi:hypothetical protein
MISMPINDQTFASPLNIARDISFDDRQLARRARTTLAGADVGLLLTGDAGGSIGKAIAVRVFDDDGEALILCGRDSTVAQAARTRRLASLVLAPNPTFGVRLTLSGRLNISGRADQPASHRTTRVVSGGTDIVVALRVDQVSAACPHTHPQSAPSEEREVPIGLYADAEPDLFAANIPRVIRHVNSEHAEQVRWLAAHATGVPIGRLAAACLTTLTANGATLCWIDKYGAHPATLRFSRPARTLEELATTLRSGVAAAAAKGLAD